MEYDLRAQKVLAKSQREKGLNPYSIGRYSMSVSTLNAIKNLLLS